MQQQPNIYINNSNNKRDSNSDGNKYNNNNNKLPREYNLHRWINN